MEYDQLYGKANFDYSIKGQSSVELRFESFKNLCWLGDFYGQKLFYKNNRIVLGERHKKVNKCVFEGSVSDSLQTITSIELFDNEIIDFDFFHLLMAYSLQFYRVFKVMSEEDISLVEEFVGIVKPYYSNKGLSYHIINNRLIFFREEFNKIVLDSIFEIEWKYGEDI